MKIQATDFKDLYIIEPTVFEDSRGYFFESFNQRAFKEGTGLNPDFVQDNQSRSVKGVIRGMHFQKPPFEQAKLVRVLHGEVLDVVVDLRPDSPTYKKSLSIFLSAENKKQLFIPRGFAHGIAILSETAEFFYKCDNFYSPDHDGGVRYDDPELALDWPIEAADAIISDKDQKLPLLKDLGTVF